MASILKWFRYSAEIDSPIQITDVILAHHYFPSTGPIFAMLT
jgi:hypothetical protein